MHLGDDEDPPVHEFGYWPELVGAIAVIGALWFLIHWATGIM